LACQTRRIAAIVAIAGAMDSDTKCGFRTPVSLLNIHGTLDRTIKFSGGVLNDHPYTSAQQTVETIATTNECTPAGITKKDFEPTIKGHETLVTHYTCQSQSQIQYWKIRGGSHSPKLPRDFAEQVITFLLQQSIQR
jgi:polyhydroxybutyrate depolymerase